MAERRKIGDWIESGYLGSGTFGMVKLWHNEVGVLIIIIIIIFIQDTHITYVFFSGVLHQNYNYLQY